MVAAISAKVPRASLRDSFGMTIQERAVIGAADAAPQQRRVVPPLKGLGIILHADPAFRSAIASLHAGLTIGRPLARTGGVQLRGAGLIRVDRRRMKFLGVRGRGIG